MAFRDEMDRLIDDFYGKQTPEGEVFEGDWCPRMDLKETDGEIRAAIELPGLNKDDIKVSVKGDTLVVSGERKNEVADTKESFHRLERSYGFFKRVVTLPTEVESDKVKAEYKDGILTVSMPKMETKKTREIPVEVS
jgi:HSP20 family protein